MITDARVPIKFKEGAFALFESEPRPRTTFSNRGFCFGCDEGRNGRVLWVRRKIEPDWYIEVVCEGCEGILDLLRPLMPLFVQTSSHEGWISWRIPVEDYRRHPAELSRFEYDGYDGIDSPTSVCLTASDDGSADDLVNALVRCHFKDELRA